MGSLEQVWATVETGGGGEFTEEVTPQPGTYDVTISEGKFFTSQKGEHVIVVTFRLDSGQQWSDVRVLTQNGEPQEGRIKAAKVMLSQLGIADGAPSNLDARLGALVGSRFKVDVTASDRINQVTGQPYVGTQVVGAGAPAAAPAEDRPVAAGPMPQWDSQPPASAKPATDVPF